MGRIRYTRVRMARMWLARHITRMLLGQVHVGIVHDALFLYADREPNQLWADEADVLCQYAFPPNDYTEF